MKKPSKPIIALNLPHVVALLIVYGRHIVQCMTGNTWFLDPDPTMASATEHLDMLEASEAKARGRGQGAVAARNLDQKAVEDDMKSLAAYVYKTMCQNPGQALAIMTSAGFKPKRQSARQKPFLAAFLGLALGEILVEAKAVKLAAAYEWQVSTDGGATWLGMGVTNVANTSFPGAVAGTTYAFRFRALVKNAWTEWSASVSLAMH